ncbi:TM2 domain-containing membrane protein YozV [Sphingomonas insulae]|uniref:TM2 domain-containing protein n=1 Tax=Sphingomonas insulae TaxID=424800 RepID=UPI002010CAFF|nr:TM2 domain-containing protein [Sphingomonas insulae]NIJ28717.1 TM2 domain-containing membrane protein YozV [Sphingomonas insulae]
MLGVDTRTGEGLVAGDDGNRYRFTPEDWAQRGEPAIGIKVDFEASGERALSVFPMPDTAGHRPVVAPPPHVPANDRSKIVAALLAFFLGTLGIHRFYLGRTGSGIAMLVLSITVIGLLVTGPWALIDMVRYLVMSDEEFALRYRRKG